MTGLTRCQAAKAIGSVLGHSPTHNGGYYDKYSVKDDNGREWAVVYDSSILCRNSAGERAGDSYSDMLKDYELEFRGVATIVPKKGSQVPILIWEIDQRDELSLDLYEGFPKSYRKELFEIEVNRKTVEGMAYLMNYGSISPPSMMYYTGILKGYKQNGMDISYLERALENSYNQLFSVENAIYKDEDFDEAFYAEDNPSQLKF